MSKAYASENVLQVGVRGSDHSMPQAIFTDPCELTPRLTLPADGNIVLDRYTWILCLDKAEALKHWSREKLG